MSITNQLLATGLVPDQLIRQGIRKRLQETLDKHVKRTEAEQKEATLRHVEELKNSPVAICTQDANDQHYELPAPFFLKCLGARLKYSSAWFDSPNQSLDQAEENMLALTCERAQLEDGQDILELGCGWGSLSLWMAEKYPNSSIVSVSNSASQKEFIDARAKERGLKNLTIRTANMVHYEGEGQHQFDRCVSVEMFEHMKNYQELLHRISQWLKPEGKLFVHIFTHRVAAYHYEATSEKDWMARYFFTGGQMPSDDLLSYFQEDLQLEEQWKVSGTHYQLTSEAWLKNMDRHQSEIFPLFEDTYGADEAKKWWNYWRIFFMSCAELWGYKGGDEWIVSHYRFTNS